MADPLQTRFTAAYGVRHPLACAGTAFVAGPELCAAVCAAGAFGAVAPGALPPQGVGDAITRAKALGAQRFHANIITPLANDACIDAFIKAAPPVVSFHWLHPQRAWIDRLQAAGIKVWEQIGSADAAKRAVDDGIDLVIAQGVEAGGHVRNGLATMALVPDVVDAVTPALVLAAGGIADGRGLAAALALGADGAMVGTRFVAAAESAAAVEYRQRLVAARSTDTVLTAIHGPDMPLFNPMRVLRTPLTDAWHDRLADVPTDLTGQPVVAKMPFGGGEWPIRRFDSWVPVTGTTGDFDQVGLPAGQGVGRIGSVLPASAIVEQMVAQAAATLHKAGRL